MEYIVSYSGGKDSTAVLLDALDKIPKENVKAVFCDTKWEPDEVYYYLDYIEAKLGIEIIRLESMGMAELSKWKKMMPNRIMRFCTEHLKIRPFQEWLKENYVDKGKEFCVLQGLRREESSSRANTPTYNMVDSIIRPKFKILTLFPIAFWSTEEVFDFIKAHNIEPNPLYKMGYTRVGCMPCIYASKWELTHMPKKYKERLRELEKIMSELHNKEVKFFPESMDRHVRQNPLFTYEPNYTLCDKCGSIMYIDNFCNTCYKSSSKS